MEGQGEEVSKAQSELENLIEAIEVNRIQMLTALQKSKKLSALIESSKRTIKPQSADEL